MRKIKKILLSQPKPKTDKSPYFDIEKKYDVTIDFRPFIKTEPLPAKDFRQQKVNILDYTAVIFTAKAGIDNYFRLCTELRLKVPDTMKYFCVTEAISLYLQNYIQYRKRKIFFGSNGKIDELAELISKHPEEKYLAVMSDVHDKNKLVKSEKKDIVDYLDEYGVTYTKAVMYKTVSTDFSQDPDFDYDMLVFFSPSGIESLFQNFPNFEQGEVSIGCMGTTTVKAAEDKGLTVNVKAPTPEIPSMSAGIDLYLKEGN